MVSLEQGLIVLGGKSHKIKKFEVWFLTPYGLVATVEEAITVCNESNISPATNIRATPVAVADNDLTYEVLS